MSWTGSVAAVALWVRQRRCFLQQAARHAPAYVSGGLATKYKIARWLGTHSSKALPAPQLPRPVGLYKTPTSLLDRYVIPFTNPYSAPTPFSRTGSRLHGIRNDRAHPWCCPSMRCAPCQSSEHAARNFARRLSCRVFRLWQLRHSQRRLSRVNARSIAAGPSARATSIASLWSISSDGSPHISQSVCWISSGCWPDATR